MFQSCSVFVAGFVVLARVGYERSLPYSEKQRFFDIQTGRPKVVHKSGPCLLRAGTEILRNS